PAEVPIGVAHRAVLVPVDDGEGGRLVAELDAADTDRARSEVDGDYRRAHLSSWSETGGDGLRAALDEHRGTAAETAKGDERRESGAVATAGFGDERTDVGSVGGLQDLGGQRRVVVVLGLSQRVAVDQQSLRERYLDLVRRLDEVLDRVLEVVRRVDHVAE